MIFIGGTGRPGTTIFAKILSQHQMIYSFPEELRFITDPDGLISLNNALVENWSFFQADIAMERYKRLMKNLQTRYIGRYPNSSLAEIVGNEFYELWFNGYCDRLCQKQIKNGWAARVNIINKIIMKCFGNNILTKILLPTAYYCQPQSKEIFNKITRRYLLDYFQKATKDSNAKIVVEHTPSNLIHFNFIHNFLPEAKLIHIYRDPRDVICSYKTKDWGNKDIRYNAVWISDILSRWEEIKNDLPDTSYYELSFEKLISNIEVEMPKIFKFINIPFNNSFLSIDTSKHNIGRWKKDLNNVEIKYLNTKYSELITRYGYQI